MKRRRLIRTALALTAGTTLVQACGPLAPSSGPTSEPAKPGKKGEFVIAIPATSNSLDPEYSSGDNVRHTAELYATLLKWRPIPDPHEQGGMNVDWASTDIRKLVVPYLAEDWQVSADGKTYTIKLRRGLKSHAGNELSADDVKWHFDRAFGLNAIGAFFNTVGKIPNKAAVSVVDRYTVQFALSAATPNFLMMLANHIRLAMLDSVEAKKHATADEPWAKEWLKSNPVGFGPYKLESLEPGKQMTYVAHEGHPQPPKVKRIAFRVVPESSNRLALVSRGDVDIAFGFSPTELDTLKSSKDVRVWRFRGPSQIAVPMKGDVGPTSETKVRVALSYAVPYESIVNDVFKGFARPAAGPLVEVDAGFDRSIVPYKLDIDKAKSLLAAAGYPNGFESSYAYDSTDPLGELVGVQLQTSFAKIGVTLKLNGQPSATYAEMLQKGTSPFIYWSLGADLPDPAYVSQVFYHSKSNIDWNKFKDPAIDKAIDDGLNIIEWDKRVAYYQKVVKMIIDAAPWLWIAELDTAVATRSNVTGLQLDAGHFDWSHADFR